MSRTIRLLLCGGEKVGLILWIRSWSRLNTATPADRRIELDKDYEVRLTGHYDTGGNLVYVGNPNTSGTYPVWPTDSPGLLATGSGGKFEVYLDPNNLLKIKSLLTNTDSVDQPCPPEITSAGDKYRCQPKLRHPTNSFELVSPLPNRRQLQTGCQGRQSTRWHAMEPGLPARWGSESI